MAAHRLARICWWGLVAMTCAKTYFILSVSSTGVVSQFWHCKAWPVMLTVSAAVTDILC
jgi:hypothetical protein